MQRYRQDKREEGSDGTAQKKIKKEEKGGSVGKVHAPRELHVYYVYIVYTGVYMSAVTTKKINN